MLRQPLRFSLAFGKPLWYTLIMKRIRPQAKCHSDRPHRAHGLCNNCYNSWRRNGGEGSFPKAQCHPDRPVLARGLCRKCYESDWAKTWRKKNPLLCRTCRKNPSVPGTVRCTACADKTRNYSLRCRLEVLEHYGGNPPKCACCGESTIQFLALDHINGHTKGEPRGGRPIYTWLRKKGFPSGFQILCHNCNLAKGFYGKCPHSN